MIISLDGTFKEQKGVGSEMGDERLTRNEILKLVERVNLWEYGNHCDFGREGYTGKVDDTIGIIVERKKRLLRNTARIWVGRVDSFLRPTWQEESYGDYTGKEASEIFDSIRHEYQQRMIEKETQRTENTNDEIERIRRMLQD